VILFGNTWKKEKTTTVEEKKNSKKKNSKKKNSKNIYSIPHLMSSIDKREM
jgi:hypothetical protein